MKSPEPINLSVVGHTNVGKTSLMRTLMRDPEFGEVAPTSATTRQVERARLLVNGRPVVELFDTPGLEDAGALIDQLEQADAPRHDGPARIAAFLDLDDALGRFEQEARVLRQMLDSDAALYVIDAREPVLGKYQDELAILALCARPLLPVLNFTASSSNREREWREALARVGLHAIAEFDTVVFSLEAEARLWQRLATLLDRHAKVLDTLIQDRRRQAEWQRSAALKMTAELLVDAAAARRHADSDDPAAAEQALIGLQQAVEGREKRFVRELLALYRFGPDDHRYLPLPVDRSGWHDTLFDAAMLEMIGKRAGGGLAAGAAAGAAFDLATGGLSLGAGTLIGALAGSGSGAIWQARHDLVDRLRGRVSIALDDRALTHLAARARVLIDALDQRGHAAQTPLEWADNLPPAWTGRGLPKPLLAARVRPKVSALNEDPPAAPAQRDELARALLPLLTTEN